MQLLISFTVSPFLYIHEKKVLLCLFVLFRSVHCHTLASETVSGT